ncbi:recombinase family protein [Anaerovorax odorimutans]|uniref:recombinase family protein n=1 Tax=Anaerovorax odorimutans TaxID=109327 RepID=UPI00040F8F26|nr:recombinase family protein [Anaerovorax odorimutans]
MAKVKEIQGRAAIYSRYSSDNQRDESIDAQIRAIEEYAKANGYEIVKIYADKAKSATTAKRPEFQRMIKESGQDLFDIVIVHKLDRFSRDKYDSAVYKRKLKQNGIRLISVTENLDGSPESVILESVIEGMAEYYSKNLAREVMKGMKETAYQAKHTGGLPPLGYDVNEEKKYVINEKEAECVRLIFDMILLGKSHSKIIDELNARGYKTKIGTMFKSNSIYSIITNEKYTGVYIFNKTAKKDAFGRRNNHKCKDESEIIRIEGGMPAIISKETFEKTRELLNKRKHAPGTNKAKENYLLSGLIRCGCCGYAMHGNRRIPKNKPIYVSYRCGHRSKTSTTVCNNKEIRKEYIEEYVLTELEKKIFSEEAMPILVQGLRERLKNLNKENNEKRNIIEKELLEINKQIENIIEAISNGFYQEEFKTKIESLKQRKIDLEASLKEISVENKAPIVTETDIRKLILDFKEYVIRKNVPECKKFIQDFVKEVIVYNEHIEVIFNVSFLVLKKGEGIELISRIGRYDLIKRYSKSFYINAS